MAIKINIPSFRRDTRIGSVFNTLFHIINDTENAKSDIVEWDFNERSYFHPFYLAPLAIYKHKSDKIINCTHCSELVGNYFRTINFEKPLLIKADSDIEKILYPYRTKTYTPICAFLASDETVADELQSVLQNIIENQTEYDDNVRMPLAYLLSEIVCNINQHSCSQYGYIYAQYLKAEGSIDIVIADDGITVYGSYIRNGKYLDEIGDSEALALSKANDGYSTKDLPQRGFGLRTSREMLVKGMGGDFFMLSGSAFYRLSNEKKDVVELPKTLRWDGTIVLMRIPVKLPKDFNFYNFI